MGKDALHDQSWGYFYPLILLSAYLTCVGTYTNYINSISGSKMGEHTYLYYVTTCIFVLVYLWRLVYPLVSYGIRKSIYCCCCRKFLSLEYYQALQTPSRRAYLESIHQDTHTHTHNHTNTQSPITHDIYEPYPDQNGGQNGGHNGDEPTNTHEHTYEEMDTHDNTHTRESIDDAHDQSSAVGGGGGVQ